ncbi:MAG UNVERIFIED_CONTAM: hypothetical protein LVR29_30030 [Microcystis novacekii LVE1205-3]|jgi:hypothetical protein
MAKAELGSLGRDFNHAGGAGIGIQRETALSFYFLVHLLHQTTWHWD